VPVHALHALIYSDDPPATRAFFRDVLGWPYREHVGSGPGWLIFKSGPSELGVHPNSWTVDGQTTTVAVHHELSLVCDDIAATVAELAGKGAQFRGEPRDMGFGIGVPMAVPASGDVLLYQPKYELSTEL
jgi:catechol 2,3-dioxygenase-like lactoylglutathione lyase family enzyme